MKLRHITAALLLLTLPTLALAEGWVKDPNTGCKIWTNTPDAASWDGACVSGKAKGKGTVTYKLNGKLYHTYEGEMKNGKKDGYGVITETQENGMSYAGYKGEFKNDQYHGQGLKNLLSGGGQTGTSYEGSWKYGKEDGYGVETDSYLSPVTGVSTYYEGQWKDGKKYGKGIETDSNGNRYEGQFKGNTYNGHGVYVWKNGQRYEGTWKNEKQHGLGKMTTADGSLYHEGQWKDGQPVRVAAAPAPAPARSTACDHVYVGKEYRSKSGWIYYRVVGFSPSTEKVTVMDTYNGYRPPEKSCSEIPR